MARRKTPKIRTIKRRKTNTKRRKTLITRPSKTKPMARRKTSRSRKVSSGFRRFGKARGKFGSFLKSGIIGDTTQALGAGLMVGAITDRLAPQFTPFASAAGEYAAGGIKGMVVAELVKPLVGLPSILPSITGGFGSLFGGQTAAAPTETI